MKTKKTKKSKPKPWLTKGIITSIKIKRKLFKQFKQTKHQLIYDSYKIYRDLLNKLIRKSKKNYYRDLFVKHANNIKKTWKELNKILHRQKHI